MQGGDPGRTQPSHSIGHSKRFTEYDDLARRSPGPIYRTTKAARLKFKEEGSAIIPRAKRHIDPSLFAEKF